MSKFKPTKATFLVVLAILLALTVGTVAFFVDRATHQMQFTTATFTDDGYTITREAPNGPYAAGEAITVPITEKNTGSEAIKSSIKMTATWSSPDAATARQLFNSAVTLKIGDTTLDYEVSADKKSITFTLPDQELASSKSVTRDLTLTVPEAFVSTGNVTFTFDEASVSQNPVGFTAEYDSAKLAELKCSTQVVWAASTMSNTASTPNANKALYGYLNDTCDGIIYEMGFNYTKSAMKDFANTSASKWSNYKSVIKTLSFPEGMTTVGDYAFDGFSKVTSVSFPSTTEGIGQYAFNNSGLTGELTIPATINTIEERAFGLLPDVTPITFNHTDSDVLTLPSNRTANSTNGAFYVEDHVDTVVNSDVVAIQYEYGWHDGWDNRRLIPTLAAQNTWKYTDPSTYDTPIDTYVLQTVRFADYYIPDGTETEWDGSDTNVPGTVTVYLSADGKTVTIAGNGYGSIYANQYSAYTFQYLSGVTSYDNIEILDTSKAEDMSCMFSDNYSVTDLEVGHFDTRNVTNMYNMFYLCYHLPKLDVSNWDTGKVESMWGMFSDCNSLTSLAGIQNWDTQNVTNMRSMFDGVESLTSLDLSTKKVTMNGRTYDSWDTGSVTDMNSMFGNTDGDPHLLKELNISTFDTRNVTTIKRMFECCTSLETLNVTPTQISLNGDDPFYTWDTGKVKTMYETFLQCTSLKSLDLSGWDTSGVAADSSMIQEDFYQMFMGCSSLETLNVSRNAMNDINGRSYTSWDTSKAYYMTSMFDGCTSLKSLNLKDWTNTAAQNMDFMFYDCESLSSIDLTNFTTPALTSAGSMFDGCSSLKTIDVSSFDTRKVQDFTYMFNDCTSLETLDVSNFSTESLVYGDKIECFAYNCPKLTTIVLGENFGHADKLPVAGSAAGMFYVSSFVDTTITGANDVMKAYDWVADKRMLVPTKLTITTQPTKTTYEPGENFDKTGMVVTATFSDGTSKAVTDYTITGGTAMAEGTTSVTVSYTLNGVTVEATVTIVVENANITITYDANGGTFSGGPTTNKIVYDADTKAWVSGTYKEPTRSGDYDFGGWYKDADGTEKFDLSQVTSSATVYAKWLKFPTLAASNTWYKGDVAAQRLLTTINIVDSYTPSGTPDESWNADVDDSGSIKCYVEGTTLTIVGNGTGKIYANEDSSYAFGGWYKFDNVASITGLDLLDTGRVTNMSYMFYYTGRCSIYEDASTEPTKPQADLSLTIPSTWDTSNVTDMRDMFHGMGPAWNTGYRLLLDIRHLDTSSVTNMRGMFASIAVTALDVSNFDTSKVTNMAEMFYCHRLLESLDLSCFDTSKVTNMASMFSQAYDLTSIDISSFDTSNVQKMSDMFSGCSSLTSLDVSNFDTTKVTDINRFAYACTALNKITLGENFGQSANAGSATAGSYSESLFYVSEDTPTTIIGANDVMKAYDWETDNRLIAPTLAAYQDWYRGDYDKQVSITKISIVDSYSGSYSETWNADVDNTGSIKCYINGTTLYIAGNGSGKIYANKNSMEAFKNYNLDIMDPDGYGFCNVTSFTGLDMLDTSNVEDMSYMFAGLPVTSLDVSGFDTSNVLYFVRMFDQCANLQALDVGNWDTSNGIILSGLFAGCSSLTSIDVSNWNTSRAMYMINMFNGCSSLTTLDVSGWDTTRVLEGYLDYFAYNCPKLTTIVLGENFGQSTNAGAVTAGSSGGMFYVSSLTPTTVDGANAVMQAYDWYSDNRAVAFATPASKLAASDDWYKGTTAKSAIKTINIVDSYTPSGTPTEIWNADIYDSGSVMAYVEGTTLTLAGNNTDIILNSDASSTFAGFSAATTITGLDNLDISEARNMSNLFDGCAALTSLTIPNSWDTGAIWTMYSMFKDCSALTSLDISNLDTGNVIDMQHMFSGCSGLTSLDVSNLDTSKVQAMTCMFENCSKLTSLDVSNFDTSNVVSTAGMFKGCKGLTTLDVSNFNTSKVTTMQAMFNECESLTTLDVSTFNTSKVTNLSGTFALCKNLVSLNVSGWDTSKVTNMGSTFNACLKLTQLDLRDWETDSVTAVSAEGTDVETGEIGTYGMFDSCNALTALYLGDWDLSKVTAKDYFLRNCPADMYIYVPTATAQAHIINVGGLTASTTPASSHVLVDPSACPPPSLTVAADNGTLLSVQ